MATGVKLTGKHTMERACSALRGARVVVGSSTVTSHCTGTW